MMGGTLGPLDNTNFNLLKINVQSATINPVTSIPSTLTTNTVYSSVGATNFNVSITGNPPMSMTNFLMNGTKFNMDVINMTTSQNTVMTWTITNQSAMPHPFHIHGNHFYVLKVNGVDPPLNLRGRKDVVTVPPNGGSVKLITQYNDFGDSLMPFMFHCHILSHEDNGMMGQFIVKPDALLGLQAIVPSTENVILYPNPAHDYLYITIPGMNKNVEFFYSIYSVSGILVTSSKLSNKGKIDVSGLVPGQYIIHLSSDKFNKSMILFHQ